MFSFNGSLAQPECSKEILGSSTKESAFLSLRIRGGEWEGMWREWEEEREGEFGLVYK